MSIIRYSSAKKHVEGFSEQFLNCLRRYVGKHVAPGLLRKLIYVTKWPSRFRFSTGHFLRAAETIFTQQSIILVLASNSMYQWAFVGVEVSKN